jgi:hypothetical protein
MAYFVAAALKNRYFLVLAKGKKEGKQAPVGFFSRLHVASRDWRVRGKASRKQIA